MSRKQLTCNSYIYRVREHVNAAVVCRGMQYTDIKAELNFDHKNMDNKEYVLIYDLETQSLIPRSYGKDREKEIMGMKISCACAVTIPVELCRDPGDRERAMEQATYHTFWCDEAQRGKSLSELIKLMDEAFLIVAYNQLGFDAMVLRKHMSDSQFHTQMQKQWDVMANVKGAMCGEKWPKLDKLLEWNGLETKSANGLQAVKWWQSGIGGREEDLDKLSQYCLHDTVQLARLTLLPRLTITREMPSLTTCHLPNYVFGLSSAISSMENSLKIVN